MKMPFGKFLDRELTEIPQHYLRWLRRQQWVGGWLVKEINDVLDGKVVAESDLSFDEALKKWEQQEQEHERKEKSNERTNYHNDDTEGVASSPADNCNLPS